MLVFTSLPFFILNIAFSIIATRKITKAAYFSSYKPRFDFIFLMIWGYVPLSFASAITDTFFLKAINNYHYCIFFTVLKYVAFASFFSPPLLVIYFFLLMFTNVEIKRVNMIGNVLFGFLFVSVLMLIVVLTSYLSVKKVEKLESGAYSECACSDKSLGSILFYFTRFIQIIVLVFIFSVIGYEKYLDAYGNKDDTKSKFSRIHMIRSFTFIVFASVGLGLISSVVKKFGFLPKWVYYISIDLKRSYPLFYSLIIIYCDQPITLNLKFYSLKVIFSIPELKEMFKNFLHEKGSKKMKNLVRKFQSLLNANGEKEEKRKIDLNKRNENEMCENERTINVLEKEIFLEGLSEFYLSNEFIYFLYKFQNTGIIELEMDIGRN